MIDVAFLLFVAALAYAIRRVLRVPLIPLLLLSGMVLRYLNLGLDEDVARNSLDMGLAVLVFGAGMELNPKRFGGRTRAVLGIGLVQFLAIGLGGVLISAWLGLAWMSALYIGLAISTSSTLIIIRLLKSRQQMFEPFGRIVTGVLLVQDLLVILLIVLLTRLPDGGIAVAQGMGGLAFLLVLSGIGLRYIMPYVVLRMSLDDEVLGLLILMVLFAFMGISYLLQLPVITGAFLAGVSLSAFPVNSVARGLVSSLTTFFLPLFFVVLGSLLSWPSWDEWQLILALTLLVLVGTPMIVTLIAMRLKLTARASIESGLLLALTSEFSLVVMLQGLLAEQVALESFNIVAMVTVLTMTITPLVARDQLSRRLMRLLPNPVAGPKRVGAELEGHVILLGYGRGGSVVLKALVKAGYDVLIVDDDPVVVRTLIEEDNRAVYGDGADPRVLDAIQAKQAKLIISSMRRVADAEMVMRQLQPNPPQLVVRVFEPHEAERIRSLGGIPVLSSEAAGEEMMRWFNITIAER